MRYGVNARSRMQFHTANHLFYYPLRLTAPFLHVSLPPLALPACLPAVNEAGERVLGLSKKDPTLRRKELLGSGPKSLTAKITSLCAERAGDLIRSPAGCDLMVEVARGGLGGELRQLPSAAQYTVCVHVANAAPMFVQFIYCTIIMQHTLDFLQFARAACMTLEMVVFQVCVVPLFISK